jgi:transposase
MFKKFVERLPGNILCDNASIHKNTGYSNFIFVPPYSPEYNPVEMAFSVVKNAFRHSFDSKENVTERVINAVKTLNPKHCTSMFAHAFSSFVENEKRTAQSCHSDGKSSEDWR